MRTGEEGRITKETNVKVAMCLEGSGQGQIDTGIGFFDHMLELFACHSGIDLTVTCKGDLQVDAHHSVEDIGITMGKLLLRLLGDKKGIARYGAAYVPMDESLARTVLDLSGRPYLAFKADSMSGKIGEFDAELVKEFFRALTTYGMMTAHIEVLAGGNRHHMAEAIFKSFARALQQAIAVTGDRVPSSKGVLEG